MDASFEVLALDGSFHVEQAVRSVYQCNECPYKSSYKQNLNRHKHTKHPMPLGTMARQAVCFVCFFVCVLIGLVNGKSQATQFDFMFIGLSKTGLMSIRKGQSFAGFSFAILIVSFLGILYMKTLNDITKERWVWLSFLVMISA